ncbi:MAG: hypothetical protein ACTSPO_15170 [Candidatus Heimdallarchaeaceae archaeon]
MSFTKEELEGIKLITWEESGKSKNGSIVFTGEYFLSWCYNEANLSLMNKIVSRIKKELGFSIIINKKLEATKKSEINPKFLCKECGKEARLNPSKKGVCIYCLGVEAKT